jgi:phosphopantothenoylcysteine decarboxylase/phosphopantothenate--cysteine ligase
MKASFLKGKKILLGITSSISAYKIYDLIRVLKKEGAEVKVILTPQTLKLISPLVISTLSENPPYWDWDLNNPLLHINLARWCDVFLIAPATINTISKLAYGIADNLLTSTWFACNKPKIIAPAANTVMIKDAVIQENLKKLQAQKVLIVPSGKGELACKEFGEGKLADIELIRDYIIKALSPWLWENKKVLITLGSTREYLDPVRFLTNASSGKMGLALAKAVFYQGGTPIIVAGDTSIKIPNWFEVHKVETTQKMLKKCLEIFPNTEAVFMNSAVVDYRFKETFPYKLKKKNEELKITLIPTPDILKALSKIRKNQLLIGFAVETDNLIENAQKKLKEKNLSAIVVNPITVMGKDFYEGILITDRGHREEIKSPSKEEAAFYITKRIAEIFLKKSLKGKELGEKE